MSLTAFPEPADLQVDFLNRTGNSKSLTFQKWDVSNPHPGFGKDPNILNEYGHTKYPMWVGKVIVNNAEEEKVARGETSVPATELKQDGPTIAEYVAEGYKAEDYPPAGYAPKSTKEEVDAFIKAASAWK